MKDRSHLPQWPGGMRRETASAYCDMSPSAFDAAVKDGLAPRAVLVPKAGPRWRRDDLDAWLRDCAAPAPANAWDAA